MVALKPDDQDGFRFFGLGLVYFPIVAVLTAIQKSAMMGTGPFFKCF